MNEQVVRLVASNMALIALAVPIRGLSCKKFSGTATSHTILKQNCPMCFKAQLNRQNRNKLMLTLLLGVRNR